MAVPDAIVSLAVVVVLVLCALAFGAWLWFGGKTPEVTTVTAEADSTGPSLGNSVLNASGYVVARRMATVSSKVTGKVLEIYVEEGMAVKKDQVLARLDPVNIQTVLTMSERELDASRRNLTEIEVRLADARRTLERNETLVKQQLVSETALDTRAPKSTRSRRDSKPRRRRSRCPKASSPCARSTSTTRQVRAPFAGVVISKDAQPGEIVSPMSAGGGFTRTGIATIVDMDSREVEVDVNEAYINRVKSDQRVEATLDAYPDQTLAAHVINIVPTADRTKATVRVRIGFDKLEPQILPDMGIKVRFLDDQPVRRLQPNAKQGPRIRVPAVAVQKVDGDAYRLGGERRARRAPRGHPGSGERRQRRSARRREFRRRTGFARGRGSRRRRQDQAGGRQ